MVPDLQCDACGRWIPDTEDSFIFHGRSLCRCCHGQRISLWSRMTALLQRRLVHAVALIF